MVTEMVATEKMGTTSPQRKATADRILRLSGSGESAGRSLTLDQWERYSPDDKLDWLLTNVQVREEDESIFLEQIEMVKRRTEVK